MSPLSFSLFTIIRFARHRPTWPKSKSMGYGLRAPYVSAHCPHDLLGKFIVVGLSRESLPWHPY